MDKQTKKELKLTKKSIKILLIFVFIIAVAGLSSSFVYKALNTPDYTEIYEERIENGEIVNPVEKYGLILEEAGIEDIRDVLDIEDLEETINNLSNVSDAGEFIEVVESIEDDGKVIIIITETIKKIIRIKKDFLNTSLEDIEKEFVYYAAVQLKLYNLQEIPFTSIRPAIQVQIDKGNYFIEISEGEIFVNKGIAENPDIILRTSYEEVFKMTEDEVYISESFASEKSKIEIDASKLVLFSKGYLNLYQELEELF